MYTGLHVQYPLFLFDFKGNFNFLDSFSKILKFYENPSSGSRVVPYGQTDRGTDMTKLIVAIRSFANAHRNSMFCGDY